MVESFSEREIQSSLDELALLGITPAAFWDLPSDNLSLILRGHRSPMVTGTVIDEVGQKISAGFRFQFARVADTIRVIVYPQRKEMIDLELSDAHQVRLETGMAIMENVYAGVADGTSDVYVQLDAQTRCIDSCPAEMLLQNIESVARHLHLTKIEHDKLKEGSTVTYFMKGDEYTIGVDLSCPYGIRDIRGNFYDWQRSRSETPERYQFGIEGCWVTDENGDMAYVEESNYSEKIQDKLKSAGHRSLTK